MGKSNLIIKKKSLSNLNLITLYRSNNEDVLATIHDMLFKVNVNQVKKVIYRLQYQHKVNLYPELVNFFNYITIALKKDFQLTIEDLTDDFGFFRIPTNHIYAKKIHIDYIRIKLNEFYRFKQENPYYYEDTFGYGNFDELECNLI